MHLRATLAALYLSSACGGNDPAPIDAGSMLADAGSAPADAGSGDGAVAAWAAAPAVIDGPIQETAVVAIDGKVFVIGGFDAQGEIVASVRVFDTASAQWSRGIDLPEPLHHANAAVVGGTIYVLGGLAKAFAPTGKAWRLDPESDAAWQEVTPLPDGMARGSAAVGVVEDKVILAGGLSGAEAVASVLAYDPSSDSWDSSSLPALPAIRDHGCGVAVAGRFFVIGGRSGSIGSITDSVLEFDRSEWVARAALPTARGGVGCGAIDGHVLVVGGEGNPAAPSGVFSQTELYAIAEDVWTSLEPMSTPRHGMGAAAWGRTLYVPGGATQQGFGAVATHETYTLAPQ